ncbi:hypothetical protein C8R45DRAFT_1075086 [Mycena sanguinolenta]|nr:hypothetical protein C8R45DRAFT_1075086 [Mycena sanguinolenta]
MYSACEFLQKFARLTIYSIDLQTVHLHVLYMLGTTLILHQSFHSPQIPARVNFEVSRYVGFNSNHARTFVCVAPDEITLEESLFIQTSAYHSYPQHPETIILNESMTDYTTHGSHVSANISFTVCESRADIAPCIMVTSVPRAVLQSSRQSRISLTPSELNARSQGDRQADGVLAESPGWPSFEASVPARSCRAQISCLPVCARGVRGAEARRGEAGEIVLNLDPQVHLKSNLNPKYNQSPKGKSACARLRREDRGFKSARSRLGEAAAVSGHRLAMCGVRGVFDCAEGLWSLTLKALSVGRVSVALRSDQVLSKGDQRFALVMGFEVGERGGEELIVITKSGSSSKQSVSWHRKRAVHRKRKFVAVLRAPQSSSAPYKHSGLLCTHARQPKVLLFKELTPQFLRAGGKKMVRPTSRRAPGGSSRARKRGSCKHGTISIAARCGPSENDGVTRSEAPRRTATQNSGTVGRTRSRIKCPKAPAPSVVLTERGYGPVIRTSWLPYFPSPPHRTTPNPNGICLIKQIWRENPHRINVHSSPFSKAALPPCAGRRMPMGTKGSEHRSDVALFQCRQCQDLLENNLSLKPVAQRVGIHTLVEFCDFEEPSFPLSWPTWDLFTPTRTLLSSNQAVLLIFWAVVRMRTTQSIQQILLPRVENCIDFCAGMNYTSSRTEVDWSNETRYPMPSNSSIPLSFRAEIAHTELRVVKRSTASVDPSEMRYHCGSGVGESPTGIGSCDVCSGDPGRPREVLRTRGMCATMQECKLTCESQTICLLANSSTILVLSMPCARPVSTRQERRGGGACGSREAATDLSAFVVQSRVVATRASGPCGGRAPAGESCWFVDDGVEASAAVVDAGTGVNGSMGIWRRRARNH